MGNKKDSDAKKLRELLKKLRKKKGVRQVDLAERLKKPQSFISKYESGEKTLTFLEIQEICKGLNISLPEFVRLFEEKHL